ncbi:MAG: MBL fold metallo-hydrolase [Candidatus Paceibacterota bacterium]
MENPDENSPAETKKQGRWLRWAILGLALGNLFVWMAVGETAEQKMLEVRFFDVGQGDAVFVQLPNGVQVLIDGGPNSQVLEKLGQVMSFYDRDIDWMILSHPEKDHLAGLLAVLKNYQIHNIIWSGIAKDNAESKEWSDLVAREGANVVIARPGGIFALGGEPDSFLEILAPDTAASGSSKNANDLSVAAKLTYGARSFLFTGDAAVKEEESALIAGSGRIDILKVAHHGSKTAASEIFMAGVLPAAAVISSGKNNSYGHPHPEVLELLSKYDIKTLRTDESGDIVFKTDGNNLFVKTEK